MKRPIFIIVGVVLVFILLGIWIYILFFSSPTNNQDSFADLNFGDTTDSTIDTNQQIEEQPVVDVTGPARLRQLTSKPTIGYQEVVRGASSTPEVLFIESGTGHIFSINLVSGEEKRVSATTIPLSYSGAITPNGLFVMVQSGSGFSSEFTIGELGSTSGSLITRSLDEKIIDFEASSDNTFLYAVQTDNSVIAKEYQPLRGTSKTLFTIPFREVSIDWGSRSSDPHYVYPKASSKLEGFLYKVSNGKVRRLPVDGYGLSALGNTNHTIYSKQVTGKYLTYFYNHDNNSSSQSPVVTIPEKCAVLSELSSKSICGTTLTYYRENIPDRWYQGDITYSDDIWEIDTASGSAKHLSSTFTESGREIDMINLVVNQKATNLYFTNKNDGALWMYEVVLTENE